jgi:hypothetical protein
MQMIGTIMWWTPTRPDGERAGGGATTMTTMEKSTTTRSATDGGGTTGDTNYKGYARPARFVVGVAIILLGVWGLFVHMPTVLIPLAMIVGGVWTILFTFFRE